VEHKVDDEEASTPVHAGRIDFISCAGRSKPGQKCQAQSECIENVHDTEVPLGSFLKLLTWQSWESIEDFVKAQEVEVVARQDDDEESCNHFLGHVQDNKTNQLPTSQHSN